MIKKDDTEEILAGLLATKEAADALRLGTQTLQKWAQFGRGPIQPVNVNGHWLWRRADIESYTGRPVAKQRKSRPKQEASVTEPVDKAPEEVLDMATKDGADEFLPEVLTTKEAAAALRLSRHTLHMWSYNGKGPITPVRLGRHLLWRRADLEAIVGGRLLRRQPKQTQPKDVEARQELEYEGDAKPSVWASAYHAYWAPLVSIGPNPSEQPATPYTNARDGMLPQWFMRNLATRESPYRRGDLLTDAPDRTKPYRIERVLVDQDSGERWYILRRTDINRELLRSQEVIEDPNCYVPWDAEEAERIQAERVKKARGYGR